LNRSALSAILSLTSLNSASVRAIRTSLSAILVSRRLIVEIKNGEPGKLVALKVQTCGLKR
jgi:hypothetical protein